MDKPSAESMKRARRICRVPLEGAYLETIAREIDEAVAEERERCATLHESVNPASDMERLRGDRDAALERAEGWQRTANRQSIEIIKLNKRVEEAEAQAKAEGDAASSIQKELEEERARVEKLVKAARQNQWWNKALSGNECTEHFCVRLVALEEANERVDALRRELRLRPADNPELDGTDGAHPAFWRGQDDGVRGACANISKALKGDIAGVCRQPLEAVRQRVDILRRGRDAALARAEAAEASHKQALRFDAEIRRQIRRQALREVREKLMICQGHDCCTESVIRDIDALIFEQTSRDVERDDKNGSRATGEETLISVCTPKCWEQPNCTVCGQRKALIGRSAPLEMVGSLCDFECPGYRQEPKPGHHWPNEECDDFCRRRTDPHANENAQKKDAKTP